jgi:hypothetical protein
MMKIRVKPLLVALALAGLSSPALAQNNMVTVPIFDGGIVVGVTGLYFVPGVTDSTTVGTLVTGIVTTTSAPGTPVLQTTTNISRARTIENDPSYQWGFALHLGYVIPGTGNDVMLNWNHLHGNNDNDGDHNANFVFADGSVQTLQGNAIVTTSATIVPFVDGNLGTTIPFTRVISSSNTDWDAVDLNFGQHVNIGGNFDLRAYAGLAWARVDNQRGAAYAGSQTTFPTFPATLVRVSTAAYTLLREDSSFNGFGPELGFDEHYCFTNTNFGVSGHLNVGMLIGNIDTDLGFNTYNALAVFQPNVDGVSALAGLATSGIAYRISDSENHRLVPEIDANLGVDYTYNFANECNSSLVTTLGYQATNYFNAVRSFNNTLGTRVESQDAFFHGPFLTVKFLA